MTAEKPNVLDMNCPDPEGELTRIADDLYRRGNGVDGRSVRAAALEIKALRSRIAELAGTSAADSVAENECPGDHLRFLVENDRVLEQAGWLSLHFSVEASWLVLGHAVTHDARVRLAYCLRVASMLTEKLLEQRRKERAAFQKALDAL